MHTRELKEKKVSALLMKNIRISHVFGPLTSQELQDSYV